MNPIEAAVLPLKADAIARAEKHAHDTIAGIRKGLEEHGWDINAAAPYPSSYSNLEYHTARAKHNRYHSVVTADPEKGYQISNGKSPYFVVMDEDRITRFIQQYKDWAAIEYDAFVVKLVKKIGPVKWATLDGNHVWGYSTLLVETEAGETQAWKTQQIVNHSKHGKPFNQWPTRKIKLATKGSAITGRVSHEVMN